MKWRRRDCFFTKGGDVSLKKLRGDTIHLATGRVYVHILTSGDTHFWLVKRKDVGEYATMGGFVDMGEPIEEAEIRLPPQLEIH